MPTLAKTHRVENHYCIPRTCHENLRRMAAADPIGVEQVATAVLASKDASPNGTIRLSQPSP